MTDSKTKLLDEIIYYTYLALVVITPLIFSTQNSELFEVPKMIFVYIGATVVFFLTLIKFVLEKKIVIPKSPILITFVVFLVLQVLSTIFSIDKFTSIYGYPTRLNGGLVSQFAYFAIFICALINLNANAAKKLIIASLISGLAVALWGIPSHFGYDPSCFVLTNNLNASCWQKDFDPTIRIFSTLGQPNWLASYLVLLIPFGVAYSLIYKKNTLRIFFAVISLILFMAFIFTNSRSGFFGERLADFWE